jgi:hypothetical protein
MEKLSHNFHVKLQEMCDCYLDTDFLAEMKHPIDVQSATLEEEAIRYFALLILYTLTLKAQRLTVKKQRGILEVTVEALHEKNILPPPPEKIADKIFEIIRAITHIEKDNGEMALALGLRSSQVDLQVKVKKKEDEELMELLFPELGG